MTQPLCRIIEDEGKSPHFIVDCPDCYFVEGDMRTSTAEGVNEIRRAHQRRITRGNYHDEASRHLFYILTDVVDMSSLWGEKEIRLTCPSCNKRYEINAQDYTKAIAEFYAQREGILSTADREFN